MKVALVDTQAVLLDGMQSWFEAHAPDISVVATFTDPASYSSAPHADVVIVGFAPPDDHAAAEVAGIAHADGTKAMALINYLAHADSANARGFDWTLEKSVPMSAVLEVARILGREQC